MPPLGIDIAWQRPSPEAVRSAGYTFVIGYLSTDPTKNLTAANIAGYQAQGLGVLLVWETTALRALDGMTAGIADGRAANAQAAALGYPADVPIFFACDTATTAVVARPYFRGVTTVRPCSGAYGGIGVVDPLLADGTVRYGWQACAWSGTQVSTTAHLYQRAKPTLPLQGSFDENVQLRPIPMFTAPLAVTPASDTPTTSSAGSSKEIDMIIVQAAGDSAKYLVLGDGSVHVPTMNDVAALKAAGVPEADGLSPDLVTSIVGLPK